MENKDFILGRVLKKVGENMRKSNIFASIDLGVEEVRLLITQKGFKGLKTLARETFPKDDLAGVSQLIEQYQPKEVVLLLPQERVIVRDVTIPPVDKSRIKSVLYFELSGALPYAMEQIQLDYLPLGKVGKTLQLKIFAIHEHFEREINALRNEGIQIDRLIPRGLALAGFCEVANIQNRLVKQSCPGGTLVVYPEYRNYLSKFYPTDEAIIEGDLKQDLAALGVTPTSWEIFQLSEPDADLLGAIYFRNRHPLFNLLQSGGKVESGKPLKVAIGAVLLAILLVNAGTFYVHFTMKKAELAVYKERMALLTPRTDKVNALKEEFAAVQERYNRLVALAGQETNYLVWLKELHMLLQNDTEVSILVLEKNQLKEMHGTAPSAIRAIERMSSSPYFLDTEFTAPITPKIDENGTIGEEFSISAYLADPTRKVPLSEGEDGKGEGSND